MLWMSVVQVQAIYTGISSWLVEMSFFLKKKNFLPASDRRIQITVPASFFFFFNQLFATLTGGSHEK